MLREVRDVRQVEGEPSREWYTSTDMDLVVWVDNASNPIGFQFCYDKGYAEKAITWKPECGYSHMVVDDGEGNSGVGYKATPILHPTTQADFKLLIEMFEANGEQLPDKIKQFVFAKFSEYQPT